MAYSVVVDGDFLLEWHKTFWLTTGEVHRLWNNSCGQIKVHCRVIYLIAIALQPGQYQILCENEDNT